MNKPNSKKIVVIGGGTGTQVTVSGLKKHDVDITAIISVADNGGSTGRLRDEFGFLPVGDLRQALAALAFDSEHAWIRRLLLYRFEKGSGLEGHNLGNLLLTALQDMAGSTPQALEIATQIFRLDGSIIPITTDNIQLVIEYEDGTVEIGETNLDHKHGGQRIVNIKASPRAKLYDKAKIALLEADVIVIGPGDLYGSIAANLVIDDIQSTFAKTKATIIAVGNLMTRYTQTHELSGRDHLAVVEKLIGRAVHYVIVNDELIPKSIRALYEAEHEFPVVDDYGSDPRIIRAPIIRPVPVPKNIHDGAPRSYLRHDHDKLADTIMKLTTRKK